MSLDTASLRQPFDELNEHALLFLQMSVGVAQHRLEEAAAHGDWQRHAAVQIILYCYGQTRQLLEQLLRRPLVGAADEKLDQQAADSDRLCRHAAQMDQLMTALFERYWPDDRDWELGLPPLPSLPPAPLGR